MDQIYDDAVDYLTQAQSILDAEGEEDNATWALAQRARAKHGKAIWQMLNPPGSIPSNTLVGSGGGAAADAAAVLGRVGGSLSQPLDQRWFFTYSSATVWNDLGWQVNERLEHRFGDRYVVPTGDDKKRESTAIMDPIDNVPAPGADFLMTRHEAGGAGGARFAPLEITNIREMVLIIAEARLADGDVPGFVEAINGVRFLDGLTPYDPDTHTVSFPGFASSDSNLSLLVHHRFEQLMLTGRLLNDHYRFSIRSDFWLDASVAVRVPGTIFPISVGEQQSNTCLSVPGSC
jgi:hypothetical protein